jgi:hypothetical protein
MQNYLVKLLKWILSIASEQDGSGSSKRVIAFIAMALICGINYLAIKIDKPEVFTFVQFCDGTFCLFILVLLGLATWNNISNNNTNNENKQL